MTKIWTEMDRDGDQLKVQVNVQDAPPDFLGTSFHLDFYGPTVSSWDYELGSVFGEEKPFVLVGEKDNALVAGISFQRGNREKIPDGNLITFYVQVDGDENVDLSFDYPVLSRFENGRKDAEGVEWVGFSESFESKGDELSTDEGMDQESEQESQLETSKVFQTSTLTYPPDGFQDSSIIDVYLFMLGFGVFVCAMAGLMYLYYRYRKTVL